MINQSLGYFNRIEQGLTPFFYIIVTTPLGARVYSDQIPDMLSVQAALVTQSGDPVVTQSGDSIAVTLDDFSFAALSVEALVLSWGGITKQSASRDKTLLESKNTKRASSMSFTLDNKQRQITQVMAHEAFLNRPIALYSGFADLAQADHLKLFSGQVKSIALKNDVISISATEGADVTLDETVYLPKAEIFATPGNDGDVLPIVYGSLTDGNSGIWKAPEIQKWNGTNQVFCFAGHAVIAQTPSVYVDGKLTATGWAFNESNTFEGQQVATITFTAEQTDDVTVQGQGKAIGENVIDIAGDFLTTHAGFDGTKFDTVSQAITKALFNAQGYKAAGVVNKDEAAWKTITLMTGSFLIALSIDENGNLAFEMETGTIAKIEDVIEYDDIVISDCEMKAENVVNQLPVSYQKNYADGEFAKADDGSAQRDVGSVAVYGIRRPKEAYEMPFCRDVATVATIQQILVALLARPTWEIGFRDLTAKRFHLTPGAVMGMRIDDLYDEYSAPYTKRKVKIVEVKPNLKTLTAEVLAIDLGENYKEYEIVPLVTQAGISIVTQSNSQIITEILA